MIVSSNRPHATHPKRQPAAALRNALLGEELARRFDRGRLFHDIAASRAVTRWAYFLAEQTAPHRQERGE